MKTYDNYSDNEYDSDTQDWYAKWNSIKQFNVNDYMSCKETRSILKNNWDDKFYTKLETPILNLFDSYIQTLQPSHNSFLYNANSNHGIILLDLIKHHTEKNYNIHIFKENPDLAQPLLNQIYKITNAKKNKKNIEKHNFHKEYNWGKQ
jgi:hypothetical protein